MFFFLFTKYPPFSARQKRSLNYWPSFGKRKTVDKNWSYNIEKLKNRKRSHADSVVREVVRGPSPLGWSTDRGQCFRVTQQFVITKLLI